MRDDHPHIKGRKVRVQLLENGRVAVMGFTAPVPLNPKTARVLSLDELPEEILKPLTLLQMVDPDTEVPGVGYKYEDTIFYIEKHDEDTQ